MPNTKWLGYQRFCPLARGLDVLGDRWTMVIIHDLLGGPARYGSLKAGLPGMGTNVLSDRLRKLEAAGVLMRTLGAVDEGVFYKLTDRGNALAPVMAEIRRWGAEELLSDRETPKRFDFSYALPAELGLDETYEWIVDGRSIMLKIEGQMLTQQPRSVNEPVLVLETSANFMARWAAGETNWTKGRASGEVVLIKGSDETWDRMMVGTNYAGRPPGLTQQLLAAQSGPELV